ncbi:MAG: 50S ribosomal protein L35 [bacterium]
MPKMKSNRAASKRFHLTASGKIKRKKAFHSHILTKKTKRRKRHLRQAGFVDPADQARVLKLLVT